MGGKIGVRLIRMAADWAQAQNAEELHLQATSGIESERTDRLMKRLGFKAYGGNYANLLAATDGEDQDHWAGSL
ncbi:MAG TPA: hypothetical protein VIL84_09270 [Devosiaceae bacterium]